MSTVRYYECRGLLAEPPRTDSGYRLVEEATRSKLRSVDAKIRELQRLRAVLARLVRSCEEKEATEECPVLGMLEEEGVR